MFRLYGALDRMITHRHRMDDVYEEQKQVANARVAWFLPQRFWITALSVVALLSLCHPEKRSCKLILLGILFAYIKGECTDSQVKRTKLKIFWPNIIWLATEAS